MNRYARIMQWIGVLALFVWLATLAQGFAVDTGRPTLAWHTIGALLAAALTLLARTWTISFLLSSGSSSDAAMPGPARRRTVALAASALSLVWLAAAFLFAGRLLWHRLAPRPTPRSAPGSSSPTSSRSGWSAALSATSTSRPWYPIRRCESGRSAPATAIIPAASCPVPPRKNPSGARLARARKQEDFCRLIRKSYSPGCARRGSSTSGTTSARSATGWSCRRSIAATSSLRTGTL
ncbi:MAG: hypothetical protein R2862_04885 [Thermoanaerobaculia bacterium]